MERKKIKLSESIEYLLLIICTPSYIKKEICPSKYQFYCKFQLEGRVAHLCQILLKYMKLAYGQITHSPLWLKCQITSLGTVQARHIKRGYCERRMGKGSFQSNMIQLIAGNILVVHVLV